MSEITSTPSVTESPPTAPVGAHSPAPAEPAESAQLDELAKPKSDLPARLVTAVVLVPAALYVVVQGGLWILGAVMTLILLGQREFYRLIEDKGAHPLVSFGLAGGAAISVVAHIGTDYQANLLMTATLLAVLVAQLGKAQITEALASVSGTFFGVFYVGWLLCHILLLRNFHAAVSARYGEITAAEMGFLPDCGVFLVVFMLFIVTWCDAGAYFGGRVFGKHKLAPAISPSKSVEGVIVGVFAGVLAALVAKGLFQAFWPALSAPISWGAAAVLALLVSAAGIIGDLIESLLKRDAQVKDTGRILPGTGGILDRIDSSLLAAPVMYYSLLFYAYMRI